MTGPKLNCEIGSRDLCRPTYGRICAPRVKRNTAEALSVYQIWKAFIRLRNIVGPKISKLGHVAHATPTEGPICDSWASTAQAPSIYQI